MLKINLSLYLYYSVTDIVYNIFAISRDNLNQNGLKR